MNRKFLACLLACSMTVLSFGGFASAEEAATEAPESSAELSDDIYSFQLKLDGDLYQFPMSYEDFTALGWELDGDEETSLEPNSYTSETFRKGYLRAYVSLINLGINSSTLSGCTVGGMSIDTYDFEDAPETTIEFPGGIAYGKATLEDIKAAYGEPSDSYDGDLYVSLSYEYDSYQEWEFYVHKESGVLDEFDVRNFVADEDANAAAAADISSEPTAEVLAYTAPSELGDDPLAFTVDYAGNLYQLPAPVSAFLENGWRLKDDSDTFAVGGGYGWVNLMKDNQELRTIANNYSANATTIENCFITSVESDVYDPNLPLSIPGGISMGMSADDLVKALDALTGIKYTTDDSSENFTYYSIESPSSSLDGIEIRVDKEENTVAAIEVEYQPDSLS